jgi:predicted nucleotidyltransferase
MHPLIEQHSREIASLCRRSHVRRLDVFGSASRREDFDPKHSDIDFLVEIDQARITPTLSTFFDLRERLTALIGRPVDLVMEGSIRNPYIRADIERSRETVYAS